MSDAPLLPTPSILFLIRLTYLNFQPFFYSNFKVPVRHVSSILFVSKKWMRWCNMCVQHDPTVMPTRLYIGRPCGRQKVCCHFRCRNEQPSKKRARAFFLPDRISTRAIRVSPGQIHEWTDREYAHNTSWSQVNHYKVAHYYAFSVPVWMETENRFLTQSAHVIINELFGGRTAFITLQMHL